MASNAKKAGAVAWRPRPVWSANTLTVTRPMKTRKGFTIQVIAPDGKTVDTLFRYR